jgi:hypothetical protein
VLKAMTTFLNFKSVILAVVVAMTFSSSVWSQESKKSAFYNEAFLDKENKLVNYSLTAYRNHNDDIEVRIEARGLPRMVSKINPVLGFGRDTDDNFKIDTWFFLTKNGIEVVKKEGKDPKGSDVLKDLLKEKFHTSFGMYVTSAATSLLSYLFLSVHEGVNVQEEFYKDFMDLEQLKIQYESNMNTLSSSMTIAQSNYYNQVLSFGYRDLASRMERFSKMSFWGYAFADIGLWITGGVLIKWAAQALAKLGIIASETAFINAIKETLVSFFEKQKAFIEARVSQTKINLGMEVAKKEVTLALSVATYKVAMKKTLSSYKIKNRIKYALLKTKNFASTSVKGAATEWRYIALNTSVQLSAEAYARYDEIYDPNPLKMAKNLVSHPDVQQNVGFMTTETIMMIGVSKNFKTTKARFMASGAVALTNSSIANLALKESDDLTRVAFDTSWETIIGNAQVQIDLLTLEFFEKLSQKHKNPKLKLVGYAITMVDMGIGYYVYSKAATYLDKKKEEADAKKAAEQKTMLVPIFAEQY